VDNWLTAAMAFFALCSVVVAGLQWKEMHDGGADTRALAMAAQDQAKATNTLAAKAIQQATDTHELAAQAKEQVSRTEQLAANMKTQADYTKIIASEAVVEAAAAKTEAKTGEVAADAALTSSKVNQSELELTQRPWLTAAIAVSPAGLQCSSDECGFWLHVAVTNNGHTRAEKMFILIGASPLLGVRDTEPARQKLCDSKPVDPAYSGETLFPGETTEKDSEVDVSRAEYSVSGLMFIDPMVCIAYRSSFNDTPYWTAYIYQLRSNDSPTHTRTNA
jgi:hypothetical protein